MNYNVLIKCITIENKTFMKIENVNTILDEGVLERCKTLKLINIL